MKALEFRATSWHSMLYRSTYGDDKNLPNNICTYFWKLLLALVLCIPILPWHLRNWIWCREDMNVSWGWILWHPVMLFLGIIPYQDDRHHNTVQDIGWWKIYATGYVVLFFVVLVLIIIFLIVWGASEAWKWFINRPGKDNIEVKSSPITEGIKAIKGRYCARIHWK